MAVVGTRNATIIGRKLTSKISFELTENDVLIVSGMARGIDAAAHKGAMYAKERRGPTIAVLGTGIDRIYRRKTKNCIIRSANRDCWYRNIRWAPLPKAATFPAATGSSPP